MYCFLRQDLTIQVDFKLRDLTSSASASALLYDFSGAGIKGSIICLLQRQNLGWLERWLSSEVHWLLLQRSRVRFSARTLDGLKSSVTPVSGEPKPSSGFHGHEALKWCQTHMQAKYTYTLKKRKRKKGFLLALKAVMYHACVQEEWICRLFHYS